MHQQTTTEEERMLTSDELCALHHMSVRMVDGDFKSCNKNGQNEM